MTRRFWSLLIGLMALSMPALGLAEPLELRDARQCESVPSFPALDKAEWRHTRSEMIAGASSPHHFARDAVTVPGKSAVVEAKFTYGKTSKDLEDESVRVLLQTCSSWRTLGTTLTDGDGWARASIERLPEPGIYPIFFQQLSDGSFARSLLWVVPEGTKVAVFDIDGTLTTANEEAFRAVADDWFSDGDYEAEAYPGAVELTRAYAQRGYLVVYLTGRPYWLSDYSRRWLDQNAMAPGLLRLTASHGQTWPSDSAVAEFKLRELQLLSALGLRPEVAYGNATTDVTAYLGAGLPPDKIWIIGAHAGIKQTQAVKGGWTSRVEHLGEQEAASGE